MNTLACALVMPAYNEEGCISTVVRAWHREFQSLFGDAYRIIVVDDGSKDRTGMLLDQLAVELPRLTVLHQKNAGHGAALVSGYRAATQTVDSEYVFHVDSDDQFRAEDFRRLWDCRSRSPFILGWRAIRHDAYHRLVITRILRLALFLIFGVWIKDSNVPFRLIRSAYLARLLQTLPEHVFTPNIFLAVMAAKDGQDLLHIPVHHADRQTGTVSIVRWRLIKVCWRALNELYAFRRHLSEKLALLRPLHPVSGTPAK